MLLQKEKAIEVLADIPGVQKSDIKCALHAAPSRLVSIEAICNRLLHGRNDRTLR